MIYGLAAAECPAIAPIVWPDGTCSNFPYQGGGAYGDDATYLGPPVKVPTPGGGPVQTPFTGEDAPAGYWLNPFTGELERLSTVQQESIGRGSGTAEASRVLAEAEAVEAERLGRSSGLVVECEVRDNCGPGANPDGTVRPGSSCLFWSECEVNGLPGNDAGLLLRPGGFESALVELARVSGSPVRHITEIPALVPFDVVPFVSASGSAGVSPYRAAVTGGAAVAGEGAGSAGGVPPPPSAAALLPFPVPDIAGKVTAAADSLGLPTWALVAAAAGVGALLLMGGRR